MPRCLLVMACLLSSCAHSAAPDAAPLPTVSAMAPTLATASLVDGSNPALDAQPSGAAALPPLPATPQTAADVALEGENFIAQLLVLFRVAACGGVGEIPARFDAAVVSRHCDELGRAYDEYRKGWVDVAEPFLASLRPQGLPSVVVYPFGGGDLASALATFPLASEFTTISLEPAGDVRPVETLAPVRLARELAVYRSHLERLFEKAHSRTDNLEKGSQAELPGEILFGLGALVVHGDEPVSLRYFRLVPDGTIAYVTQTDIDAAAHHPRALRALFDNVELRFRKVGDARGPVQVLRHIAFNLDDESLRSQPALLAHLSAKGKVSAMTKAATHLLWNGHFSAIRGWLIEHTDWMVSDSTGIPPRYAEAAGFTQDTYGKFDGPAPFGAPDERDGADLKRLFASEPSRELAFRYGYPDRNGHAHLIVTRR